jgi:hypothetical protein
MSRVSAAWGCAELSPAELTASLRLNGAGPNVRDVSDWPAPSAVCSHCQSAQRDGCGYCKDYEPATE